MRTAVSPAYDAKTDKKNNKKIRLELQLFSRYIFLYVMLFFQEVCTFIAYRTLSS